MIYLPTPKLLTYVIIVKNSISQKNTNSKWGNFVYDGIKNLEGKRTLSTEAFVFTEIDVAEVPSVLYKISLVNSILFWKNLPRTRFPFGFK